MNTYIIFMTHAFYISIHIFKVKEFYYYINGLLVIKYSWDKLIGKEVSALSIIHYVCQQQHIINLDYNLHKSIL